MKFYKCFPFPSICLLTKAVKITPSQGKVVSRWTLVTLLFVGFCTVSFSQTTSKLNVITSISVVDSTLESVLTILSKTEGVRFSYISNEIPLKQKITLHLEHTPLHIILDSLLYETDVKYYAVGTQIVLKKEEKTIVLPVQEDTLAIIVADTNSFIDTTNHKTIFTSSIIENQKNKKHLTTIPSVNNDILLGLKTKDTLVTITDSIVVNEKDTIVYKHKQKKRVSYRYKKHFSLRNTTVAIIGGPSISSGRLTGGNPRMLQILKDDLNNQYNFYTGLYITYSNRQHTLYRTGLTYFNVGTNGHHKETLPGGFNIDASFSNTYTYLSIPLMIGRKFGERKLSVSAFTGLALGIFTGYSTTFPENAKTLYTPSIANATTPPFVEAVDPKNYSYTKTPLIFPVVLEGNYQMSKHWGLMISTSFQYFLSASYSLNGNTKNRPYFFNSSLGLHYTF